MQATTRARSSWIAAPSLGARALSIGCGLLSLLAVVWSLRGLDLAAVGAALEAADWRPLLLGCAAVQAASIAKALRWRVILSGTGVPLSRLAALIFVGQFANNILAPRAGDLARVEILARSTGLDRARVLGGIAAEKLLDLLMLGLLLLALLPVTPLSLPMDRASIVGAAGAALLALVALSQMSRRLSARGVAALVRRFGDGARALRLPSAAAGALGWGIAAWAAGALGNLLTLQALGVQAPVLPSLVLLLVLYAGLPVPALPGRIGLHQALCLAALAPFAVGEPVALAAALLIYLESIALPSLVGGLALYRLGAWLRAPHAAT